MINKTQIITGAILWAGIGFLLAIIEPITILFYTPATILLIWLYATQPGAELDDTHLSVEETPVLLVSGDLEESKTKIQGLDIPIKELNDAEIDEILSKLGFISIY